MDIFFFQAEDGIRDGHVTGVQTCALPISIIADNIGVEPPKSKQVSVSKKSAFISTEKTPHLAETQRVAVVIGNQFNGREVVNVLNYLQENNVFIHIISDQLGTVVGSDGTQINVDHTFTTTHPYLFDSFYIVGGTSKNQEKLNQGITQFVDKAYSHYRPIGVATTARSYLNPSEGNNLKGVVFTQNNPNFERDFVKAIAKQRFWDRT